MKQFPLPIVSPRIINNYIFDNKISQGRYFSTQFVCWNGNNFSVISKFVYS